MGVYPGEYSAQQSQARNSCTDEIVSMNQRLDKALANEPSKRTTRTLMSMPEIALHKQMNKQRAILTIIVVSYLMIVVDISIVITVGCRASGMGWGSRTLVCRGR